jgi:hypothetical protein
MTYFIYYYELVQIAEKITSSKKPNRTLASSSLGDSAGGFLTFASNAADKSINLSLDLGCGLTVGNVSREVTSLN